jgi:hypothetical protein
MRIKVTNEELYKIKERFPVVFNELFQSPSDIAGQFGIPESELDNLEFVYAFYEYEDYSGSAFVIYFNPEDEQYYEVHGGHCSCYGLENQWEPEVIGTVSTFIEYLERRNLRHRHY